MEDNEVTEVQHVPPHETTASPVDVSVAMPRYFGITPPTLLFGTATATLAVAIVLAILAHWIAALVLGIAVLVELVLFVGVARRKPDTVVARASVSAIRRVRERAAWFVETATVRNEAQKSLAALRRELLELDERREHRLRDLGAAVFDGDEAEAQRLKEELGRLHEETAQKEARTHEIVQAAQERLDESRLRVQPTVVQRPEEPREPE